MLTSPKPSLMPRLLPFVLLPAVLAGCAQHRSLFSTDAAQRQRLEQRVGARPVVLRLLNGQRAEGTRLRLYSDGARWVDAATGEERYASYTEIVSLRYKDVRRGCVHGVAIGSGLGLSLGTAAALRARDQLGTLSSATYTFLGTLSGALLGAAAGCGGAPTTYVVR